MAAINFVIRAEKYGGKVGKDNQLQQSLNQKEK